MKHYSVRIIWKRRKRIPKVTACIWLLLGLFSLYCMILLFSSSIQSLDDLQELKIHIDSLHLFDSYDTKGSRIKLTIIDGDNLFYVWYPQSSYMNYAYKVETELLTGETTSVTAKVVRSQTIRDKLLNQRRIIDLRNGDSVYYDLDAERLSLSKNYISCWILFLFSCFFWMFSTLFIAVVYRIVIFQKK